MPPVGDRGTGSPAPAGGRGEDGDLVTLRQLPMELLGDPQFLRRFRAEAPIVAHLDATYVVRTRALVEDVFGLALVTDYVDGVWLRSLLQSATAGRLDATLVVLRDTLLGLEVAHREGILHRDLRSDRILVDRHGISRIAELGVVGRTSSNRWIPGTPEYMAPELWIGEEPTIASDLYAATVVLLECLRGVPPFQEGGPVVIRDQHLGAPLPVHDLPPEVASLVMMGMARSPEHRYLRAWDYAADVAEAGAALGGPHWERRGRRRLAAAVEAMLAPAGPEDEDSGPPRGLIGRARLRRRSRL